LVLSAITSRVALSIPVRTTSSRTSPSPTLIWLVEGPTTRSASFLATAASPTRVCALAEPAINAATSPIANREKALTRIHFITDRSILTSYRIARASEVME
jgi:hypothetical protein